MKKSTDWAGWEKEEHFDAEGKKIGETKFTTDRLGSSRQEHYDAGTAKAGKPGVARTRSG